jgi:hypothetical protein
LLKNDADNGEKQALAFPNNLREMLPSPSHEIPL